ncbi:MAG: hypothetical protein QM625_10385 [Ralstonia sp.]|jgi:hypothetical protein|uniref:Uncharacterized protein n=2 Tax=Ralstonia pickettii TaxID=329 RepID=A0A2P4REL8_RALPI|nr:MULTISPECIES: hypothetical protein [Ralstonia]MBA4232280.1 hypothetical protein [Ralstonia sp.]MBA4236708.1 hypothetical protein [Ralstonia sp.]MBA4403325.1 hypothetical protein [Ralstonia sp.]MBA9847586.1 hypothetical protein [Ralstonia pickettii]MBA9852949.1 hypothetical protein [Ralstonia pickettii]
MLQFSQYNSEGFGTFGTIDAIDAEFMIARRELVERYSPDFAGWVAALREHHQAMVGQGAMVGGVMPRNVLGCLSTFVPSEQVLVLALSEAFEPALPTLMLQSPEVFNLDSPDGLSCDTALAWTAALDDGAVHSLCVPVHSLHSVLNSGTWNDNARLFVRVLFVAGGSVAFGGFALDESDLEHIQCATICAQSRQHFQLPEAAQEQPVVTGAPREATSRQSPLERVLTPVDVYITGA